MRWRRHHSSSQALEHADITLRLRDYNDIFSDFDPRHYTVRAVSADFLDELRRASRDKGEVPVLKIMLSGRMRSASAEAIIKERLQDHFKKHFLQQQHELLSMIWHGLAFLVLGVAVMFLASWILLSKGEGSLLYSFLVVLLEPAGWFLFWEGLYEIVFNPRSQRPELHFYSKMAKSKIIFADYRHGILN